MALCCGKKYNLCGGGCEECVNIYKKTEKEVSKLFKIDEEEYGFEYLDDFREGDEFVIKLEYIGDDMEYKEEEDFENYEEWREFRNKQYEVGDNHFAEMIKEINERGIKYSKYEGDEYDYPCVYITFKLEK